MVSGSEAFSINPALDVAVIRAEYERSGRVQIANFLAGEGARSLATELSESGAWNHVFNVGEKLYEMPAPALMTIESQILAQIDAATAKAAAIGFQFRYDSIRVTDNSAERLASGSLLELFALFMSDRTTLSWLESATGVPGYEFADAQATRYRPGAYLTRHDDDVAGKQRLDAYVLCLNDEWRPEWGGLLSFIERDDCVEHTIVPRFNALSLFAVGQMHYVSEVASYAPAPRMSVTGWLRERAAQA